MGGRLVRMRSVAARLLLGALLALPPGGIPAHAVDLPKRKSGLWEVTAAPPGGPPAPSSQLCIDAKSDDLARQLAEGAIECSRQEIRREGETYVIDSVCRLGESMATTRTRISGSFDSAYTVEVASTYDPPLYGQREGRATVRARWLGPCRPGQRPGDMTLPGGRTINILDAQKRAPGK